MSSLFCAVIRNCVQQKKENEKNLGSRKKQEKKLPRNRNGTELGPLVAGVLEVSKRT